MHLQELKQTSPTDLLRIAEELEIENASTLRKPQKKTLRSLVKALLKSYKMGLVS